MKKFFKKNKRALSSASIALVICSLLILLFTFKLSTFTTGASQTEINYITQTSSLDSIMKDPSFLPHKVMALLSHKTGHHGLLAMRGISVFWALAALLAFYHLIKKWHTRRIALMSVALFASSSWFLVVARHASPLVLLLASPLIILLAFYFLLSSDKSKNPYRILIGGLLVESTLFTPFMLYIILVLCLFYRKPLTNAVMKLKPKWQGIIGGSLFSGITLFIFACGTHPDFAKSVFGLNSSFTSLNAFNSSIAHSLWSLFATSKPNEYHLGSLPYLDAVSSALIFLGAYFYLILHRHLARTFVLLTSGILMLVLSSLQNISGYSFVLVPFVFIGCAAGLTILLGQWFTVFPRNPLARSVGVSIVVMLISLTSIYHLSRYFIAFRYAPETRATYSLRQ